MAMTRRKAHGTQVMASANARYGDGVGKRVARGPKQNHLNRKTSRMSKMQGK